jgi:1,4-alpha-glucan branching enzyme
MKPSGHIALVLHAHLPYVRHPEQPRPLEEHWLFEAITDCYLPLYRVLREAAERGSRFRLTLSLSPTLIAMLADPLLRARYRDYLGRLLRLCEREAVRPGDDAQRALARYYRERIESLSALYQEALGGDLVAAYAGLAADGILELMTTAATHGYLPLLRSEPAAVRAQLRVARDAFTDAFGFAPRGLWLPECGYYPGLETEVLAAGYRWVVLEAHALEQGEPRPRAGAYAPLEAGGVAVFGRDRRSAEEVWSRDRGYPGHPLYREYHRDLGFEADAARLGDFLPPGVAAAPTGVKYHRVTGGKGPKQPYDPFAALGQAERDASAFVVQRRRHLAALADQVPAPILVAPYDAELFGHWWYEGPDFLAAVIRAIDAAPDIQAVGLGEHLAQHGTAGALRPAASSWGEAGYNATWLRPETGWACLGLHEAAVAFKDLVHRSRRPGADPWTHRVLHQAARSLMLAQSSDWTFHLGRGGGARYAESRLRDQLARFRFLTAAVDRGPREARRVSALEAMDNLFARLDLNHFA